ncbi:substrate-binding domain-containing protein [Nostoc muscorum FACHB-395]|jgi:ABC-type phosphate transport system substrate-binding protein|nr:substrate-binding domain-containing protein [Desmonostoc muscorum FACHB-395]
MAKVALLIGVSEYEPGLTPLPAATKDVEAMQRVLLHPEIGGFDEVKVLLNSQQHEMAVAIEALFAGRQNNDLVLLFFSGHGIKDESGKLYFAARNTRKTDKGVLFKATTVPATFVHEVMSNSRSRREVVILDCCFSGAFAEGMSAKDNGFVDIKNQLGEEGRAVLTSSTSTQFAFEQQGADISTYTRYIVEGLETGAADRDQDGWISVDELHDYAAKKVQESTPAMKPEIYAIKEGYKIQLAKAPIDEPKLKYRREVEYWVEGGNGEISFIGRTTLDELRDRLRLTREETAAIEVQVLEPIEVYKQKLHRYEEAFRKESEHKLPLSDKTRTDLIRLQGVLGLRDEDIGLIEASIIQVKQANLKINPIKIKSGTIGYLLIGIGLGFCVAAIIPSPFQSYLFTNFIDSRKRDKFFSDLSKDSVPEGTFKYGGSTSWAPVYPELEAEIERDWPNLKLEYDNSLIGKEVGSAVGIQKVIDGELAFALSSRSILDTELQQAKNKGFSLKEVSVAKDAVAVAVNFQLNVPGLTQENLKSIYTGEIENWKEFGGPDIKITVYSRNNNSGTTVQFKETLGIQKFGNNVKFINTTTEALQKVARDISGIYYASASEIVPQCTVKSLPLSFANDQELVAPYMLPLVEPNKCLPGNRNKLNFNAFKPDGKYPLTRDLIVVIKKNGTDEDKAGEAYANLLKTDEGQSRIHEAIELPFAPIK